MSSGRVSFDINFPLNATSTITNLDCVEMMRKEYQHEICVIRAINQRNLGLRSGDPVQVTCSGAAGGSETFIGYFDHVRDSLDVNDDQRRSTIVCVGATWYMQEAHQKVWKNHSISMIARTICARYNLTVNVQDFGVVRTYNQAGESDWGFLCRLAKEYGYVVYPRQTVVNFVPRTLSLPVAYQYAPRLTFSPRSMARPSDIYSFKPIIGDGPQIGGKKNRVKQTVSPVNTRAKPVTFADNGLPEITTRTGVTAAVFTEFDSHTAAVSPDDLRTQVQGARDENLWTYKARASVRGIANTGPTDAFYLNGLDDQWNGYWVVEGVNHIFRDHFVDEMELELGTNSLGPPVANYTPGTVALSVNPAGSVPRASWKLNKSTAALPPLSPRGGPNNPLRWVGSPASLDPVNQQVGLTTRALRRMT